MISATRMMLTVGAMLAIAGASHGCKQTPDEAHSAGVEAKVQADEKVTEARNQADQKIAEAHQDVVKATDEANKVAAQAQATANDKIRDDNRVVTETHTKTLSWAQEKIDDVDHMIDAASTKAQTAAPKAKIKFNHEIEVVKHDRDALHADMATLETHAGDKLDKSKEQFTARVDRIKTNIQNIEKSL
jgi:small-conductance mechanosensitive channel